MNIIAPSDGSASAKALVATYSLEMTAKDLPALEEAKQSIPQGTRINVTFLPNEDFDMRVSAATAVKRMGFVPVPHIAARSLRSRAELERFLDRLQSAAASENVFVVGGDRSQAAGPYASAVDVLESGVLTDYGVHEVAVAGYPEGHPLISTRRLDDHLRAKIQSAHEQQLATRIITQFAFDTEPVMRWIRSTRADGIESEIRVGTPGPAGIKRLLSFARRFGIGANAMIVKKYGFSLTNLMGTAGPDHFVTALSQEIDSDATAGAVGIHLYAFGGLLSTSKWAANFASLPQVQAEQ